MQLTIFIALSNSKSQLLDHTFISMALMFITLGILAFILFEEHKFRKISSDINYREEMFRTLCANVNDVFLIFDSKNMKFEYISPNFENILGQAPMDLVKNNMLLFNHMKQNKKEQILSLLKSNTLNGKYEDEIEYYNPVSHKQLWLLITIQLVYNKNVIERYICSMLDITAKKNSELDIKEALVKVNKANEAKKEFLSHMSHELKTPINAIIGMTQIAGKSVEDTTKVEDCLNKISSASNQLLTLINHILDISKADKDRLTLCKEPFSLSATINSLSTMYKAQAELNNINYNYINSVIEDNFILGDSLRLGQIITNFLSNSLKFTPSGGFITLEVSEEEKRGHKALYRFIVSDTGKGMSETFKDQLFLPYHQEDYTIYAKYGGTGLGMSIAKELIHLMGGDIKVISKLEAGTKIVIDIAFELVDPKGIIKESDAGAIDRKDFDFTGKSFLVVEDNSINQEITCEFLKYVNAKTDCALNGFQALEMFLASEPGTYDAILMDVQMPDFNGYEVTKAIRSSKHPDAMKIIIIAITADDSEDCILNCINSDMNYHIAKPIDMHKLYTLLESLINKEL